MVWSILVAWKAQDTYNKIDKTACKDARDTAETNRILAFIAAGVTIVVFVVFCVMYWSKFRTSVKNWIWNKGEGGTIDFEELAVKGGADKKITGRVTPVSNRVTLDFGGTPIKVESKRLFSEGPSTRTFELSIDPDNKSGRVFLKPNDTSSLKEWVDIAEDGSILGHEIVSSSSLGSGMLINRPPGRPPYGGSSISPTFSTKPKGYGSEQTQLEELKKQIEKLKNKPQQQPQQQQAQGRGRGGGRGIGAGRGRGVQHGYGAATFNQITGLWEQP